MSTKKLRRKRRESFSSNRLLSVRQMIRLRHRKLVILFSKTDRELLFKVNWSNVVVALILLCASNYKVW